jgi:hypothetical protein
MRTGYHRHHRRNLHQPRLRRRPPDFPLTGPPRPATAVTFACICAGVQSLQSTTPRTPRHEQ